MTYESARKLILRAGIVGPACIILAACDGVQSALAPQGPEAERVFLLLFVLVVGGTIIFLGVAAIAAIAIFASDDWRRRFSSERVVVGLGLVFPTVTLTALLAYGLMLIGHQAVSQSATKPLQISVRGEQWWWRIVYTDAEGRRIESANELRIPVGRQIEIELTSADVIHSFWIPKLAGKLDMIPGRKNVLRLVASTPGISRGQCAEYCGGAHALMSFYVVALPEPEFESWLAREASPAETIDDPNVKMGQLLFLSHGCGGCHAIRGTSAFGKIGPDLTHVGGRMSLAAGTLPNDAAAIARWITDNQHIKPQNRMPPFGIFSQSELSALSSYLASLK